MRTTTRTPPRNVVRRAVIGRATFRGAVPMASAVIPGTRETEQHRAGDQLPSSNTTQWPTGLRCTQMPARLQNCSASALVEFQRGSAQVNNPNVSVYSLSMRGARWLQCCGQQVKLGFTCVLLGGVGGRHTCLTAAHRAVSSHGTNDEVKRTLIKKLVHIQDQNQGTFIAIKCSTCKKFDLVGA